MDPVAGPRSALGALEGASDPDDMILVIAASCPVCSTGGTVVLGYGPNASPEDADLIVALERTKR